jgi:hypothetical protein
MPYIWFGKCCFFAQAPVTLSGLLLLAVVGDETDQGHEVRGGVLLIQLLLHVSCDVRGQDFQQGLTHKNIQEEEGKTFCCVMILLIKGY